METTEQNKLRARYDSLIRESLELEISNKKFKKRILALRKEKMKTLNNMIALNEIISKQKEES